jgi:hypothetical protein
MATPRRPYVSIRLGTFDDAIAAGVSSGGVLLLARLLTHRDKRSVPGLLRSGLAGLSESLGQSKTATRRGLIELERAHLVRLDAPARVLYVEGAIDADPPRTENSVRGMAAQVRELPATSPVTLAVRRAIEAALSEGDKASAWLATWRELAGPDSGPDPSPESGPDPGPDSGPHARARTTTTTDPEIRSRDPRSETRARGAGGRGRRRRRRRGGGEDQRHGPA